MGGFAEGFHVGYRHQGATQWSRGRNHPYTLANCGVISTYIQEEVLAGRIVGPLAPCIHNWIHCSPFGLVPKGRGTGWWRMIVDLSCPEGASTNDGISSDLCSLKYSSVDDALQFIRALGQHTLLIKVDLKSAYRMVPIHSADHHLFGIRWNGMVYVDQALPFGLRSAPKLFSAVADAIGWALTQAGIPLLIHYLDDLLFFVHPLAQGPPVLDRILDILESLGVPVAVEKIEGPATIVTFLGVLIDTSRFELRLPEPKINYIRELIGTWRAKRSGRCNKFESLLGHLSHAATIIRQGRIFLRHLFNILSATCSRHHHVHLDGTARADLLWWEYFLQQWNGTMFFPHSLSPMFMSSLTRQGHLAVAPSCYTRNGCKLNGHHHGLTWILL